MQLTQDQQHHVKSLLFEDWDVGLLMSAVHVVDGDSKTTEDPTDPAHESEIPNVGGCKTHIRYDPVNVRGLYLDEYTRQPLPHDRVQAATRDGLNYFNSVVWELANADKVLNVADA